MNIFTALSIGLLMVVAGCSSDKCCQHDHGHSQKQQPQAQVDTKKTIETKTVETKTTAAGSKSVVKIESTNAFKEHVLNATGPVIVDFTAKWCGACQTLKPTLEQIAQEMGDKYTVVAVDVDHVESLAHEYGITGMPTLLFFSNGKELVATKRVIGAVSKPELVQAIQAAFGK